MTVVHTYFYIEENEVLQVIKEEVQKGIEVKGLQNWEERKQYCQRSVTLARKGVEKGTAVVEHWSVERKDVCGQRSKVQNRSK